MYSFLRPTLVLSCVAVIAILAGTGAQDVTALTNMSEPASLMVFGSGLLASVSRPSAPRMLALPRRVVLTARRHLLTS